MYGVIFLFKYLNAGDKPDSGQPDDGTFDPAAAERIFFAAQTIQNACGTQALLSVLLNQDDQVDIGPSLREFKDFTAFLPSDVSSPSSLVKNDTDHHRTRSAASACPTAT